MRSMCLILIPAMFLVGEAVRADKPASPATRTEVIADGKFLFVMLCPPAFESPDGQKIRDAYPQSGLYMNDGSKKALWTVDWYREGVTVLPDGVHMIRHGRWPSGKGGKLDLKQEAVSFFANGKLLREYAIADLVDDASQLPRSVSHFMWMKSSQMGKMQFEVVTHDGNRVRFDLTNGKILEKKKAG